MQVQKDIREGHAQTVDKVLQILDQDGGLAGASVCDAGCGTGSLAIPLALRVSQLWGLGFTLWAPWAPGLIFPESQIRQHKVSVRG